MILKSLFRVFEEKDKQLPDAKLLQACRFYDWFACPSLPFISSTAQVQESLIKSSEPNSVIRDNKLVIELFD